MIWLFCFGVPFMQLTLSFNTKFLQISSLQNFCRFDRINMNGSPEFRAESPYKRRIRYSGKYPKLYEQKYKELSLDKETIRKVIQKGDTPAGTHVPIMVDECLHYLGLNNTSLTPPRLAVDCTLGYGGHSWAIVQNLLAKNNRSKILCIDQDEEQISQTEIRLRGFINTSFPIESSRLNRNLRFANINFEGLKKYLDQHNLTGAVSYLIADLGLSSMQIDDSRRGFNFKQDGPLDMRMSQSRGEDEDKLPVRLTAFELLKNLTQDELETIFRNNSDEPLANEIAKSIKYHDRLSQIPNSTKGFVQLLRTILKPHYPMVNGSTDNNQVDSSIRRIMQAIRIEVNSEFSSLESLLRDLPLILAPNGRAVFLTFHSGEDRRVKKSLKMGFKSGVYSDWSSEVVRPGYEEQRLNRRSRSCKLRWCVKSENQVSQW